MTARALGAAAIVLLLVLAVIWHLWWLPPVRVPVWFAVLLHVLPLLPALLLLLRGHRAAIFVGALGALIMFSHGVMEAWASSVARLPALIEVCLALGVIIASSWNGFKSRRSTRRTLS